MRVLLKKSLFVIALILLCCVIITGCVNSEGNSKNIDSTPAFDTFNNTAYINAYGAEYKIFDGALYARGINSMNIFGEHKGDFQEEWFKLADNVIHVDAFNSTLVYLTKNGELYGLGESNSALQVEDDENNLNTEYITIPVLLFSDCKYASVGMGFVIAIKNDNSLWFWGESKNGQGTMVADEICSPIKIADRIKAAKAFYKNSAWIDEQDNLYICGDNSRSQIGNGEEHNTYWQDYDCIVSTPYLALSNCTEFSISKEEVIVNAKTKDGNEYMWGSLHGGTPRLRSEALPQQLTNSDIAAGVMYQNGEGVLEASDGAITFYYTIIDEPPYNIPAIYKTIAWDEANDKKLVKSGLRGEMSMIGGSLVVSSECDDCLYLISFDTIDGGRIKDIETSLLYDKYAMPVYVEGAHSVILAVPNETRELVLNTQTGKADFRDTWDETKFDNKLSCSREDAKALALKQVENGRVDSVSLIYKSDFSTAPLNSTITKACSSYPLDWCWKITVSSDNVSTNIIINANTKEIIMA